MPRTPNIGRTINQLYTLRERIRKKESELKILKEQFDTAKERVILLITDAGSDTARSSIATATTIPKRVFNIADWDPFEKFVYAHRTLYMMYRRVANTSVREWEDVNGKIPPGLETREFLDLSLVKRPQKDG